MMLLVLTARFILGQRSDPHTLHGLTTVTSCDNLYAYRSLSNIIWGCLATIFASTWISVHPNVPAPGHGTLRVIFKRLGIMAVAAVAPEVIVYFAARQWSVARRFSKEYGVSHTHGFFFSMGGFVSRIGNRPITTIDQLQEPVFGSQYLSAIRATDVEDIMDKSKGDAFSKGIACLQALWFIIQCIARAVQHLPVTQLELATLAFSMINVFTWLLWWNKPLDVYRPLLIGPSPEEYAAANAIASRNSTTAHKQAFKSLLVGPLSGDYDSYDPMDSIAVPTFWSSEIQSPYAMWIEVGVGMVFGAVHCTSWNAHFPSADEQMLWRCGSVLIVTLPAAIGCSMLTDTALHHLFSESRNNRASVRFTEALLDGPVVSMGLPIYSFVVLCFLFFPSRTLRGLPPAAFTEVNWTVFLPHF
ncbi:hypothetical protein B0H13DRAFT_2666012 [Mycena leptocephala]|nr:hypothetical protein B0H13DRAFT_2666012 [Mycena leptocephala]